MPRKLSPSQVVPLLVADRLLGWGRAVRHHRHGQRLTSDELAQRAGVSLATLKRIESGDVGVSAASYLSVLGALSLLDEAAPVLSPPLRPLPIGQRVRPTRAEREGDDEWF